MRKRYKAVYLLSGFIVLSVLNNVLFALLPGLITHLLAPLVLLAYVLVATRNFRTRGELIERPRAWWRATGRPLAGYLLGALFVVIAITNPLLEPKGVPENLPGWWLNIAVHVLLGVYYLHSSVRLTLEYRADRRLTEGGDESIEPSILLWLFALEARDHATPPEGTSGRARSKFGMPRLRFAVAGDPLRPSGFALTTLDGDVQLLAVSPERLRRGIGRELLGDAIMAATTAGIPRLTLDVRVGNASAIALYESFGFRPAGDPLEHPLGGEPIQRYSLPIVMSSGVPFPAIEAD